MIKIMKAQPEIPDDEIREYMDFDGVLAKQKQFLRARYIRSAWIVSGVILLFVAGWFLQHNSNTDNVKNEVVQNSFPKPDEKKSDSSISVNPEVTQKTESVPQNSSVEKKKTTIQADVNKKEEVKTSMEQTYLPAEPVEGYPHLYEYFNANLVYPAGALKDSVQGALIVNFIINQEGKPEDIRIENSLGPLFDQEALRLIKGMPVWNPASLNNKPVKSRISIPLTFQLAKIQK